MKLLIFLLLFSITSFSQVVKDIEFYGVTVNIEIGEYAGESIYYVKLGVSSCDNISFKFYNKREEIAHSYTFSQRVSAKCNILKNRKKLKGWFLEVYKHDGSVLVYDIHKEAIVNIKNKKENIIQSDKINN